jgi:hypothetical protein
VLFVFLMALLVVGVLGAGLAGGGSAQSYHAGDCAVSDRFPDKVTRWCGLITQNAGEAGLHPDLLAAVILQESGGNERATSHSGAVGLMQVMPRDGIAAGFKCKGQPCFQDRPSIAELQDPAYNIQYGTRLLQGLAQKHGGDLRAALREYGPMDMGYQYADIVLGIYREYGR